ncbi:ADP-ribosylglycohydrolase family protein [Aureivirga sp. CE67]|uniref:ADP-ribosylglycohydrolase family protein n=1 Tax=Aureivirga sp. CE67 TaxID=1788983 RepID=UPI0018CB4959|nr:ADP-ribosylglycohydrolase family protein [Aureivirga sp. CE67]
MTTEKRLELARKSLLGTSIGDAFGESFFGETEMILEHLRKRKIPKTTWDFTDDTIMAIAVYEQLEKNQEIIQDELIQSFVRNHEKDLNRGYGATARKILREIGEGGNWKEVSQNVFEGMGSMGNGASMRVCPIGAFFFDDLKKVKEQAIKSAEITHTNIEGITGAIAVSIASALAVRVKLKLEKYTPTEFIEKIVTELPDTDTTSKIKKGIKIPYNYHIETVKSILGNGVQIIAKDTVPFSIWCAAHNLDNFEESIWKAITVLGDRDTICAIVGGITMLSSDEKNIPQHWVDSVEKYEESIFYKG